MQGTPDIGRGASIYRGSQAHQLQTLSFCHNLPQNAPVTILGEWPRICTYRPSQKRAPIRVKSLRANNTIVIIEEIGVASPKLLLSISPQSTL